MSTTPASLISAFLFTSLVTFFVAAPAFAQPSLSAAFELPAKESDNNQKICDQELKALPKADGLSPADLIKAVKAIPPFPKETAAMLETLATSSLPTDKADLQKSVDILDKAPTCWDKNSLDLQFKGAKTVLEQGTKRQKEDFTAAFVNRLRAENKKQLLILPLVVALDTLDQLAQADLLISAVKDETQKAHERAQELAKLLSEKYPNASDEKDNKKILEIRRAELSSSRQIQALIDSVLKKI